MSLLKPAFEEDGITFRTEEREDIVYVTAERGELTVQDSYPLLYAPVFGYDVADIATVNEMIDRLKLKFGIG
jgi:hypothetical protein